MTGGTDDIALPLPGFNPMAKEHAAEAVDSLIDMEAEIHATAREIWVKKKFGVRSCILYL